METRVHCGQLAPWSSVVLFAFTVRYYYNTQVTMLGDYGFLAYYQNQRAIRLQLAEITGRLIQRIRDRRLP